MGLISTIKFRSLVPLKDPSPGRGLGRQRAAETLPPPQEKGMPRESPPRAPTCQGRGRGRSHVRVELLATVLKCGLCRITYRSRYGNGSLLEPHFHRGLPTSPSSAVRGMSSRTLWPFVLAHGAWRFDWAPLLAMAFFSESRRLIWIGSSRPRSFLGEPRPDLSPPHSLPSHTPGMALKTAADEFISRGKGANSGICS